MQTQRPTFEAAAAVGALVRSLHDFSASFVPPRDAAWQPWFGRELGQGPRVIGHCDIAPWNLIARDGVPVALIDWELAGPVDPMAELAQAAWLNARLYSDDVAERESLPPPEDLARQLRALVDAYGVPAKERRGFLDIMIELCTRWPQTPTSTT